MITLDGKAALAGALLTLLACSEGPRSPGASPAEEGLTTITLLTPGDDYLLSPIGFLPEIHFVSDPLHLVAEEPVRQGETRTWLYRLRPGIRWHDGAPFTTRDIAFSSEFYRHPDVAMEDPEATTLEVLDDSTFTITYHRDYPGPLSYGVYLPEHILGGRDPADRHDWDYWRQPIGYGPFRYVRTQSGEFIELEANPDYYLGRPGIDRVVLKLGGNPLAELMSENVDIATVSLQDAAVLEADPRFQLYWSMATKLTHLYWNHRHPALGDVRVRKALALAIDRVELARALDFPDEYFESRPRDVYATGEQVLRGDYPDAIPFDPDAAVALLEEGGWVDRDGDGLRERDGIPLRFRVSANEMRQPIAVVLQSQWSRIGVETVIDVMNEGAAFAAVREGAFDAHLTAGNFGNAIAAFTNEGPRRSHSGYDNPVFDSLMTAWEDARSAEDAEAAFRALWPILHEEVPVTLLLPQGMGALAAHRRVRGLDGRFEEPLANLAWIWIDEDWEENSPSRDQGGEG